MKNFVKKFQKKFQKIFYVRLEMANNEKITLVLGVFMLIFGFWLFFDRKMSYFKFWKNAITRESFDIARRDLEDVFYPWPWADPLDQVWAKTECNQVIYGPKMTKKWNFIDFSHFLLLSYEILLHVWRSNSSPGWPTGMIKLLAETRDHLQKVACTCM